MLRTLCLTGPLVVLLATVVTSLAAQEPPGSSPLLAMVEAERAFAARATVVGWKQAFIEYFADDALGFAEQASVSAREQVQQAPDPPRDLQLLWEPRWGDAAGSGELGYLTGPSTTINPARNNGAPRHGNYASIWKRQADGRYKVLVDVGVNTPEAVPFPPGFTAAPNTRGYTGRDTLAEAQRSLAEADATLTRTARDSQAVAYGPVLGEGVRLHRPGVMPLAGRAPALDWLAGQPPYADGASRLAEVAASRDMGYTWGTFSQAGTAGAQGAKGVYVRVWTRGPAGRWQVVLDVTQPQ